MSKWRKNLYPNTVALVSHFGMSKSVAIAGSHFIICLSQLYLHLQASHAQGDGGEGQAEGGQTAEAQGACGVRAKGKLVYRVI